MELTNPWIEKGRQAGEAALVLRLLSKRLGKLPQEVSDTIGSLPVEQLENLAEAIFEIQTLDDLKPWLG